MLSGLTRPFNPRYQSVLQTHVPKARLVDANRNGRLDKDDFVFSSTGASKVGKVLHDRVLIDAAIVDACYDMAASPHAFALFKDAQFSSDYWRADETSGFLPKPGIKPSQAMRDIFAHPSAYRFECATDMIANMKAGTCAYIRNWDVSPAGIKGGWQGENVIYLGDGKFFGHPFGVETADNIIKHLNTQRKLGSRRSASLTQMTGVLGSGVLSAR